MKHCLTRPCCAVLSRAVLLHASLHVRQAQQGSGCILRPLFFTLLGVLLFFFAVHSSYALFTHAVFTGLRLQQGNSFLLQIHHDTGNKSYCVVIWMHGFRLQHCNSLLLQIHMILFNNNQTSTRRCKLSVVSTHYSASTRAVQITSFRVQHILSQ